MLVDEMTEEWVMRNQFNRIGGGIFTRYAGATIIFLEKIKNEGCFRSLSPGTSQATSTPLKLSCRLSLCRATCSL